MSRRGRGFSHAWQNNQRAVQAMAAGTVGRVAKHSPGGGALFCGSSSRLSMERVRASLPNYTFTKGICTLTHGLGGSPAAVSAGCMTIEDCEAGSSET